MSNSSLLAGRAKQKKKEKREVHIWFPAEPFTTKLSSSLGRQVNFVRAQGSSVEFVLPAKSPWMSVKKKMPPCMEISPESSPLSNRQGPRPVGALIRSQQARGRTECTRRFYFSSEERRHVSVGLANPSWRVGTCRFCASAGAARQFTAARRQLCACVPIGHTLAHRCGTLAALPLACQVPQRKKEGSKATRAKTTTTTLFGSMARRCGASMHALRTLALSLVCAALT